jgi:hypothetical protein
MADSERTGAGRERWAPSVQSNLEAGEAAESAADIEKRLAVATEYAAYQLGQINLKLDRLIAAIEAAALIDSTNG